MFDWVVVGGCAVGVARGCSDPRCAENRVQSRVPKKNREMGGLQHPAWLLLSIFIVFNVC